MSLPTSFAADKRLVAVPCTGTETAQPTAGGVMFTDCSENHLYNDRSSPVGQMWSSHLAALRCCYIFNV
eukprot:1801210-Amphidinium_carterae.1